MGAFNTYSGPSSLGKYKDIYDELFYVNANETQLFDMSGNDSGVINSKVEWVEKIEGAQTLHQYTVYEGMSISTNATPTAKNERYNYIEEFAVPFDVTKRAAELAKNGGEAGVTNLVDTAMKEAQVKLKIANELSMTFGTLSIGNATAAGSQMDGLVTIAGTLGTDCYLTAITSATETTFRTALNTNASAGGLMTNKKILMLSYTHKDSIGLNWKGNATDVNSVVEEAKIYADVKIYVSQYGPITVVGNRNFNATLSTSTYGILFEKDYLNKVWLYNSQIMDKSTNKINASDFSYINCFTLRYDKPTTLMQIIIS
jgi:hypothetical protein